MRPVISEFSYGYAVTEQLINYLPYKVSAAPTFPSLREEGTDGGYDLKLNFSGMFLFLQFKLAHLMVRRTCYETQEGCFDPPLYRFYLRAPRFSNQHRMLLDLERSGELVFYVAPIFFDASELNNYYLSNTIVHNSIAISPLEIGEIRDDDEHSISYKFGAPVYRFSKPIKIREYFEKSDDFLSIIQNIFKERKKEYTPQNLNAFAQAIKQNVISNYKFDENFQIDSLNKLQDFNPLRQIGYLSRNFFNSEFIVITE
ncbi:MAG: hypothetical protein NTX65_15025 [Ignavibacteriales bacterium]|nr:hypothetical protein [Ignavibacteriales bacterium]